MAKIDKIYLDIYGVLRGVAAPEADRIEFLRYLLDNFTGKVYWLTSFCRGGTNRVREALNGTLPEDLVKEAAAKILPTDWQRTKTEALDFSANFVWFDDILTEEKRRILAENGAMRKFFEMNPRRVDMIKKALNFLENYDHEIMNLTDADFGMVEMPCEKMRQRIGARAVLVNTEGKIGAIRAKKRGYLQLPGGEVEPWETLVEGLQREVHEEMGYEIVDYELLGQALEQRFGQPVHSDNCTFVYVARVGANVGAALTEEEAEEGFEPVWIDLKEALALLRRGEEELAHSNHQGHNYSGSFSNRRDLLILEYYQKWLNE